MSTATWCGPKVVDANDPAVPRRVRVLCWSAVALGCCNPLARVAIPVRLRDPARALDLENAPVVVTAGLSEIIVGALAASFASDRVDAS